MLEMKMRSTSRATTNSEKCVMIDSCLVSHDDHGLLFLFACNFVQLTNWMKDGLKNTDLRFNASILAAVITNYKLSGIRSLLTSRCGYTSMQATATIVPNCARILNSNFLHLMWKPRFSCAIRHKSEPFYFIHLNHDIKSCWHLHCREKNKTIQLNESPFNFKNG